MTPVHSDTLMSLTSGIQSEVASYVFYVEAAKKSETVEIKEILENLAGEEKHHFQVLERQYDSLVRSEKWISTADILKQEGLPEINEEMSDKHRNLIDEVAKTKSLLDILDIAYRLEVAARDLYSAAAQKCASEEGKKIFNQLVKFETRHMGVISDLKKKHS